MSTGTWIPESCKSGLVKKAFGMLAFIGKGIEYKRWDIMLHLYVVGDTTLEL